MFDSIYSIALDILNNVGGDATRFFDSNFEIALAILGAIGGDDTQEFDSVYSILEEIYKVRFGSVLVDPDSVYAIADAINHAINDSDSTKYDSTYSILLHIDQNPLAGHKFSIITDETNVVIINGRRTREVYLDEGEEVEWSVSKEGYATQSGTYTMTDEDYSIEVTLVILQYTVTISATPVDATIVINGEERDTLTADYGTTITYSVSAEHYATQTGTFVLHQDEDLDVVLSLANYTFSIEATPADATVVINGEERTSFTAPYGTSISWSVSKTGYTGQNGTATLESDHVEHVSLVKQSFLFTIVPTPADATVVIDGVEQTSKNVEYGDSVSWSVSKTGYTTQSDTEVVTSAVTRNVNLTIMQFTFTIEATPADATVVINGEERSSITADYGTTINWSVSKTGYTTQSGTETLTETYSMNVDLTVAQYTFTIEATPVDATVVINGVERTSYTAAYGTEITWSVSKSHYITQTGSYTLTGDHYETVELALDSHTFTISATPNDATVIINGEARTSITAVHGSEISWSVSRTGYVSQSGTYTLVDDHTETVTLALDSFTVTIVPTPSDATVMINGNLSTTYTGLYGSVVTWSVEKTGYTTQTGFLTLEQDITIPVTLSLTQYTFTIDTDANNTVIINGEERTSLTVDYGTEITWSVSREHYTTQTGTYTLVSNHTETVTLVLANYTLTIVPTPSDATVTIDGVVRSSISVPYGTLVDWEVSKTHYTTQSGNDVPVVADQTLNITLIPVNYTITFDVTPNDATITVNGSVLSGTTYTAAYGEAVAYVIEKEGYTTVSNSVVCSGDATITVVMEEDVVNYFTLEVVTGGTIKWVKSAGTDSAAGIKYSKDGGATWSNYIFANRDNPPTITANAGDKIIFEGLVQRLSDDTGITYRSTFVFEDGLTAYAYGPMTTLLGSSYRQNLVHRALYGVFYNNTGVLSHPTKKITINVNSMNPTALNYTFYGCTGFTNNPLEISIGSIDNPYRVNVLECTFCGCTGLTSAPDLSNIPSVKSMCYATFQGCTSLVDVPDIKQEIIRDMSFRKTFYGCTSLQRVKILSKYIKIDSYSVMDEMFSGCTSLNDVTCLVENVKVGANNWLYNVASSGTFTLSSIHPDYNKNGANSIPSNWTVDYMPDDYLAFDILEDGTVTLSGSGKTLQYSTDNGSTWTSITTGNSISVESGDKILWKGTESVMNGAYFATDCEFMISGELWSIINPSNRYSHANNIYAYLFKNCTKLKDNPNKKLFAHVYGGSWDAFNQTFYGCTSLVTPNIDFNKYFVASTYPRFTFEETFGGCTSLQSLPGFVVNQVPSSYHCSKMFYGCTSLTTAPALPATTLAVDCYYEMFYGCTSLTTAPDLPATSLASNCYHEMFSGCTGLTTAPDLPATSLASGCYKGMFNHCTSLTTAPALPATTLAASCYENMFSGCSIQTAPALMATITVENCYKEMFWNCTQLSSVTCLSSNITSFNTWLRNVNSSGTFIKHPGATWTTGDNGIPSSWTVNDYYPSFNITFNIDQQDATLVINGTTRNSYVYPAVSGESIMYYILKQGYEIVTGSLSNITQATTITVNMVADPAPQYFTVLAVENSTFTMSMSGDGAGQAVTFYYSTDGGSTWQNYTMGVGVTTRKDIILNNGDKMIMYGNAPCLGHNNMTNRLYMGASAGKMFVYGPLTSLLGSSYRTNLADYALQGLFSSVGTKFNSNPYYPVEIESDVLGVSSLQQTFYGSGINNIKCLATNISASNCTNNWVTGVLDPITGTEIGTFTKDANTTWPSGDSGIPSGWTVVNV